MAEVLSTHSTNNQPYFASTTPRASSRKSPYVVDTRLGYQNEHRSKYLSAEDRTNSNTTDGSMLSSAPSSPWPSQADLSQSPTFTSSPSSFASDIELEDEEDTELPLPSYESPRSEGKRYNRAERSEDFTERYQREEQQPPTPPPSARSLRDYMPPAEDDTSVRHEPSQHVDYLSHNWREEDIWLSWRHIVSKRKIYGERSRLENASWRTWTKAKYNLKTISPESLNWLKDCDVTWLYGPLQTTSNKSCSHQISEPASRLSKNNSFLGKKPILKKRSMSEIMLQKSRSSSSLLKQAAAVVQAQEERDRSRNIPLQNRILYARESSDLSSLSMPSRSSDTSDCTSSKSTSGAQTPDHCEKRHIRFDNKVEQCIAVDCKDCYEDDEDADNEDDYIPSEDESSDDGLVMKHKTSRARQGSRHSSRRGSLNESMIIAKLPSTTLKYRTDSPDIPEQHHSLPNRSNMLQASPSQETIRPTNPSSNFLLPDDEDEIDISWEPSGAFARHDSLDPTDASDMDKSQSSAKGKGMRRTESGMFMPYGEDDEEYISTGLLGKVVDTVNTARDIAHVIWNVGWRK